MKGVFKIGLSVFALICGGGTVHAQTAAAEGDAAAAPARAVADIVVTARKRAERSQTVPITITALDASAITSRQITNVRDVQRATPVLNIVSTGNDLFSPLYSLRGASMVNLAQNTDPTAATYVDGVYQGVSAGNLSQYDLESIQVLEGPQGTLFGRNSVGGAILIAHKLPTDIFEGSVKAGYGNYDQWSAQAMFNVPLGTDVALRVVGLLDRRGRLGTTTVNGGGPTVDNADFVAAGGTLPQAGITRHPVNDLKTNSVFATLSMKPSDDLDIVVRAGYDEGKSHGGGLQPNFLLPGSQGEVEVAMELFGAPYVSARATLGSALCTGNSAAPGCVAAAQFVSASNTAANAAYRSYTSGKHFQDPTLDQLNINNATRYTASATATYDVSDDLQLKSITGYVRGHRFAQYDFDGSPFAILDALQDTTERIFTEELQLGGSLADDRLKYTAGVFYYHKSGDEGIGGFSLPLVFGTAGLTRFEYNIKTSSISGYAQGSYALTPQINVTGGVRYTSEKKRLQQFLTLAGIYRSKDRNWSYLAEVDYRPVSNVMIYAKTSRSFRSGGPQASSPANVPPFKQETVTDYEAGFKSDLLDGHLRLNGTYYREYHKDFQQTVPFFVGTRYVNGTFNIGKARMSGFELQAIVVPVSRLRIGGSLSILDPDYTFVDPSVNGVTLNTPIPNTQRHVYTMDGSYSIPSAIGEFGLHADWRWQSKTSFNATLGTSRAPVGQGTTFQKAYGILNGRISFTPTDSNLEVALWAKNLLNQEYYTGIYDQTGGALGTVLGASVSTPRMYGIEASLKF